jgi:hypothetical protein
MDALDRAAADDTVLKEMLKKVGEGGITIAWGGRTAAFVGVRTLWGPVSAADAESLQWGG